MPKVIGNSGGVRHFYFKFSVKESDKMITIKISHDDAIYLQAILQSDKREYCDGIISLKEIMQTDPDKLIGKRNQTPSEAIETTQKAIGVLDRVLDQLNHDILTNALREVDPEDVNK